MKEQGILFSAPMVLAQLDDRKTQTRRLKGLEQINKEPDRWHIEQEGLISIPGAPYSGRRGVLFADAAGNRVFIPALYAPNTLLWTREAWRLPVTLDELSGAEVELRTNIAGGDAEDIPIQFEADKSRRHWNGDFQPGRYRHARFMPRWASRIDRQYIGERTERVQDISEADVHAEGWLCRPAVSSDPQVHTGAARDWYSDLWESLNGTGSWDANPWVRVIEFRRVDAQESQQAA